MTLADSARPVVLITGAARRLGAHTARRLHGAGYDVVLHCRHSRNDLDRLRDELETNRPDSTLALQADLADLAQIPPLVSATLARFGRLDALVNNASAFYATPLGQIGAAQWDDLFASNARAPLFMAQAAAPALRASRGAIVNMLDFYASQPLRDHVVYSMAKSAQATMTLALAQELAPEVRVNGIAPGAILWPDAPHADAHRDQIIARTLLQRVGTPDEIADAVLWLLRDATFMTGQVLHVDGGRLPGV